MNEEFFSEFYIVTQDYKNLVSLNKKFLRNIKIDYKFYLFNEFQKLFTTLRKNNIKPIILSLNDLSLQPKNGKILLTLEKIGRFVHQPNNVQIRIGLTERTEKYVHPDGLNKLISTKEFDKIDIFDLAILFLDLFNIDRKKIFDLKKLS